MWGHAPGRSRTKTSGRSRTLAVSCHPRLSRSPQAARPARHTDSHFDHDSPSRFLEKNTLPSGTCTCSSGRREERGSWPADAPRSVPARCPPRPLRWARVFGPTTVGPPPSHPRRLRDRASESDRVFATGVPPSPTSALRAHALPPLTTPGLFQHQRVLPIGDKRHVDRVLTNAAAAGPPHSCATVCVASYLRQASALSPAYVLAYVSRVEQPSRSTRRLRRTMLVCSCPVRSRVASR